MRKIKAFLVALLLFAVTVIGCHFYIKDKASVDSTAFGTMPSEEKGKLRAALTENMSENGYPIFGSSEFQHGKENFYHPSQVFSGTDFQPMLIGAGYYQSLSHAITLASIEDSMKVQKAALILSPQWFRSTGVVDQAYASRFSETHYAGAMANEKLDDETKQYISDRTQKLLNVDTKTQKRVKMYDDVLWKKNSDFIEAAQETLWSAFLSEKEDFQTMLLGSSKELKMCEKRQADALEKMEEEGLLTKSKEPDWTALLALAEQKGEEENQNQFYMDEAAYKRLEPHLSKKEGMNSDAYKGYQTGPEYDDLECFLKVCQQLEIEPLIVIVPVNGYYYDFTGFPKEARQNYYEKVRTLAESYGARIADFSDQEYTKYFFEDRVHLGKKGWVMVDESLYNYYKEA